MIIVPVTLREPLRKLKRYLGIVAFTVGGLTISASLLWVFAYFCRREFNLALLVIEFGFWGPVLIFNLPGVMLVFHGRRFMCDELISLLELVEVVALLSAVTLVVFMLRSQADPWVPF